MISRGNVLMVKGDKLLVLHKNRYYIIKGQAKVGDDIDFETRDALAMPSYLFAIAAMEEEDLDETLDFIQSEWFADYKK